MNDYKFQVHITELIENEDIEQLEKEIGCNKELLNKRTFKGSWMNIAAGLGKLDPQDYLKSRGTHFDRACKALYNDIMNDSNLRSKFTETEIAIFKEGGVLKAYTWHHHQDEGVMQLVDRKIHRQTGHTGGFSIWGPGN